MTLRMKADREKYVFEYLCGGDEWRQLGQASTRFVATEVMGRSFMGTVIGIYTTCNSATGANMRIFCFSMSR